MITIEQVREAKAKIKNLLQGTPEVFGWGITTLPDGRYAVYVDVTADPANPIPSEIDGVPVVVKKGERPVAQ